LPEDKINDERLAQYEPARVEAKLSNPNLGSLSLRSPGDFRLEPPGRISIDSLRLSIQLVSGQEDRDGMRVCLQRVQSAKVTVEGEIVGEIGPGLVLLAGFRDGDDESALAPMAQKIANLRIFEDDDDRMNLSLLDLGLAVLVVSQFTLYADTRKGRRPSFTGALEPVAAEKLYLRMAETFRSMGVPVATGRFGAKMLVEINNWGPVTMVIDS
jgi:D-tyrosyl-tRNA(Tyr) deacylase